MIVVTIILTMIWIVAISRLWKDTKDTVERIRKRAEEIEQKIKEIQNE